MLYLVFIKVLAKLGQLIPSAPKPVKRPSLGKRLIYTALVAIAFILLSSTPLYGTEKMGVTNLPPMMAIVLAMTSGTLAQLGIGPIVTAGLILQILVGAKIINMDLSNPEDRSKFTLANKGLAIILAIVEAIGFVISGMFWKDPGTISIWIKLIVFLQLIWGSIIIITLDEATQKGWGIGSGISLFILIGVAQRFFSDLLTPHSISETNPAVFGLIPYIINSISSGNLDINALFIDRLVHGLPSLTGLIVTIILIAVITYLSVARINIPISIMRYGGIKTKVPLQLLYVSNIPVLLTGILLSNVVLILNLLHSYLNIDISNARLILSSPNIAMIMYYPFHSLAYIAIFIALCIVFGLLWIELAGLSPESQAENLVKAELNVPGMRSSTKILGSYLARYVYPLTVFSSLAVAAIALVGDMLGSFGSGIGLLLAVGILYNFYQILVYERTVDMYPMLKRFLGE